MTTPMQFYMRSMFDQGRLILQDGKMRILPHPIAPGHSDNIKSCHNSRAEP